MPANTTVVYLGVAFSILSFIFGLIYLSRLIVKWRNKRRTSRLATTNPPGQTSQPSQPAQTTQAGQGDQTDQTDQGGQGAEGDGIRLGNLSRHDDPERQDE